MAIAFVGAGTGVSRTTTGTSTVSKTGCTAGNIIIVHAFFSGDVGDWSAGTWVNVENFAGTDNTADSIANAVSRFVFVGRAIANGTCSIDVGVGASGDDYAARVYEFSGGSLSTTFNGGVFENINTEQGFSASATILDADVTTTGTNRLAMNFVGVRSVNAIPPFTGMSGGTWAEVAEYNGTTVSLQLQTADMPTAGVIDGGSGSITSAYWISIGTAMIAAPPPSGQTILPDADVAAGGWTTSPLFSKVNDASDATLITNTAS